MCDIVFLLFARALARAGVFALDGSCAIVLKTARAEFAIRQVTQNFAPTSTKFCAILQNHENPLTNSPGYDIIPIEKKEVSIMYELPTYDYDKAIAESTEIENPYWWEN